MNYHQLSFTVPQFGVYTNYTSTTVDAINLKELANITAKFKQANIERKCRRDYDFAVLRQRGVTVYAWDGPLGESLVVSQEVLDKLRKLPKAGLTPSTVSPDSLIGYASMIHGLPILELQAAISRGFIPNNETPQEAIARICREL